MPRYLLLPLRQMALRRTSLATQTLPNSCGVNLEAVLGLNFITNKVCYCVFYISVLLVCNETLQYTWSTAVL